MRLLLATSALAAALIVGAACGGGSDKASPTTSGDRMPQVSPSAAGPTPAPTSATPVANGYAIAQAFPQLNFDKMLGVIAIPGTPDDVVVLTQDGIAYRASLSGVTQSPSVYLDLTSEIINNHGNEEGLLGLAFAPDFSASGGKFYVYYTAGNPRRSVISRFTAAPDGVDPASEHVMLEVPQPFANHNGGQMVFGPDGMLYIALGDGGSGGDPMRNGQKTDVLLGKILRIDVSGDTYAVPPDNPFASGGGRGEVFAYGLRNPWRFTFDRETQQIWAGDVGQNKWEEVDHIIKGGNYGWNVTEGDACYEASTCESEGFQRPRAVYDHSGGNCSITGGYVYRGTSMHELDGWYVYADFCSGRAWAVDTADETSDAVVLLDTKKPVSSFFQATDGELYFVTYDNAIYRLQRK